MGGRERGICHHMINHWREGEGGMSSHDQPHGGRGVSHPKGQDQPWGGGIADQQPESSPPPCKLAIRWDEWSAKNWFLIQRSMSPIYIVHIYIRSLKNPVDTRHLSQYLLCNRN